MVYDISSVCSVYTTCTRKKKCSVRALFAFEKKNESKWFTITISYVMT